ncbi:MAG: hypothetical protein AB8A39_01250 [Prochlorococcus sp.]
MVLEGFSDRFPQLQQLQVGMQRSLFSSRVVVAVDDTALTLLWQNKSGLNLRHVALPPDLCRDGLPLQPQALGEFLADLMLEMGVLATEVCLLLPLQSCHWRLLSWPEPGADADRLALLRQLDPPLHWPLSLAESYLTLTSVQPFASDSAADGADSAPIASMLVGTSRRLVQAWIEVVEAADLALAGVEWMLTAAWRQVRDATKAWQGDLVWLVSRKGRWRMLLLRDGLPELDHGLGTSWQLDQPADELLAEIEACLHAWREQSALSKPLAWWITAGAAERTSLGEAITTLRDEECLGPSQFWTGTGQLLLEDAEAMFWTDELASLIALAMAGSRGL